MAVFDFSDATLSLPAQIVVDSSLLLALRSDDDLLPQDALILAHAERLGVHAVATLDREWRRAKAFHVYTIPSLVRSWRGSAILNPNISHAEPQRPWGYGDTEGIAGSVFSRLRQAPSAHLAPKDQGSSLRALRLDVSNCNTWAETRSRLWPLPPWEAPMLAARPGMPAYPSRPHHVPRQRDLKTVCGPSITADEPNRRTCLKPALGIVESGSGE